MIKNILQIKSGNPENVKKQSYQLKISLKISFHGTHGGKGFAEGVFYNLFC